MMEEDCIQVESDTHRRKTTHRYLNKITIYTLLCFALAGLIVGFAIGGFAGHIRGA
jgi:hypothetical protein